MRTRRLHRLSKVTSQKKRNRGGRRCVRLGTDRENTPMFSKLPSHKVRQLVFGRPSDRVYPASLPHDGLTSAWGSEIRTASGLPDERSPRVFHIPDAQHRDCSLAFAVLRGRRCTPHHPISLWESAVLPLLGSATSVVSLKRLCSTASSANTWRPFSSKPKIGIPAVNCLASFAPSLSATCAADSSATASPASAVRLATMSCWWLFPARIGVSVHHALGDGWPTLRHTFGTVCFPPFQFGSGS